MYFKFIGYINANGREVTGANNLIVEAKNIDEAVGLMSKRIKRICNLPMHAQLSINANQLIRHLTEEEKLMELFNEQRMIQEAKELKAQAENAVNSSVIVFEEEKPKKKKVNKENAEDEN